MNYRFLSLGLFLLSSCSVDITPKAVGGSKSDGTVTLGYEYGQFDRPNVDMAAAQASAERRCIAWGYKHAEPFDAADNVCEQRNLYGTCTHTRVNIRYQCVN
ncbi:hypothetical protein AA23498_2729 [Acetobacter nitrogenifigens DSM 23921 = NBRC 105050]|uniref:YecR-like lipoprotein n=2 Tax=Acetobacter nitrogenifigens TaxID=285268 RepID=A0A511XDU2_9PROT|nr:hypothetical protein AA23498_2729 [Acetobacter nitrogenifigens DSM 23921 = NBRC 105050]GEN61122.1 hypothetical protein ANI02nite_30060 [Acetobacter nitrogenifigens DSM 23921 = NBRC 105050]